MTVVAMFAGEVGCLVFGLGYSAGLHGWRGPFHGVGCENEGRSEVPG